MNFLMLPVNLVVNDIIVAYLELEEVGRFDIACCSHSLRLCDTILYRYLDPHSQNT